MSSPKIFCCLSLDSYIKPQLAEHVLKYGYCCLSLDSYIKPQLSSYSFACFMVVYLLIPTSNHNFVHSLLYTCMLFISWFLHQTTTIGVAVLAVVGCLSLDSYIKPQHVASSSRDKPCCLSLDSYIKPQHRLLQSLQKRVVYLLIPTSNHNSVRSMMRSVQVVYLLIPTSNHNGTSMEAAFPKLFISWFLHQTTTG